MASRKSSVLADILLVLGFILIGSAIFVIGYIYLPVAKNEFSYQIHQLPALKKTTEIIPLNKDFGIVIPKIAANAKVIANVDPYNSAEYQKALSQGVAQAKGSALPDEFGNVFIFSHSSSDFVLATRYNSIFYLLDKLKAGDEVDLYFHEKKYVYSLEKKMIVKPTETQYLKKGDSGHTLTLMTCWPPGTNLDRLIWQGNLTNVE